MITTYRNKIADKKYPSTYFIEQRFKLGENLDGSPKHSIHIPQGGSGDANFYLFHNPKALDLILGK